MTHLWEHKHDYYCEMQNYRASASDGCAQSFECWADFIAEWADVDADYNLLFRWDWMAATDDIGEQITPLTGNDGELRLCFMMQRKGDYRCVTVRGMSEQDEDAVRKYLAPLSEHMRRLWAPLL